METMADPKSKTSQDRLDPFVLDAVFPDARTPLTIRPPKISDLKDRCVFFLDTNVLKAPYLLGNRPAGDISSIYQQLADEDRLFIAKRVAQEFARLRRTILSDLHSKVMNLKAPLGKLSSPNEQQCPMLEGHPPYDLMMKAATDLWNAKSAYDKAVEQVLKDLKGWDWSDPISELYAELFSPSRIIDHGWEKEAILDRLQFNIAHSVPPGYKDAGKDDEGIGDLLIWLSMVAFSECKKLDVVFVSDDSKADWVIRSQSQTLGVRPELFYEFYAKTDRFFAIISFPEFLALMDAQPETVKSAEERAFLSNSSRMVPKIESIIGMLQSLYTAVVNDDIARAKSLFEAAHTYYFATESQFDEFYIGRMTSEAGFAFHQLRRHIEMMLEDCEAYLQADPKHPMRFASLDSFTSSYHEAISCFKEWRRSLLP